MDLSPNPWPEPLATLTAKNMSSGLVPELYEYLKNLPEES
jgi:hypothetical protein